MRRMITWLLYIFMGVQIAFGCVYFATNFQTEQRYAENLAYSLPMGVISILQLLTAAFSAWYFLGMLGDWKNKYKKGYVCAYLLTVPYVLQMHTAKLAWSLSLSVFLWMLGLVLEIGKKGLSKKRGWLLPGAYFLYGVICPDGLWLGGILLLAAFLVCFGKERREEKQEEFLQKKQNGFGMRVKCCLAILGAAGAIFLANMGLNSAFPEARRIYRENNLGTAVVSRFVWPNFATNYFFWDDEIKAVLSEEDAIRLCQRIDLLEKEFYPALQEAYGNGKAMQLCLKMGYRCLMDRSRETVSEIGKDFIDYLLLPFTIEKNLQGKGTSLTAWNYGRMKAHTPLLVKYYYRYGIYELPVLLLGSFLLWSFYKNDRVGQFLKRRMSAAEGKDEFYKVENGEISNRQWKLLVFALLLYTLWYTIRSNLPIDYKQAMPILFFWYLASIGGLLCQKAED